MSTCAHECFGAARHGPPVTMPRASTALSRYRLGRNGSHVRSRGPWILCLVSAMALNLSTAHFAVAHQFSFAHGTVTIHVDRIDVVIEFDGEDLSHLPGAPTDDREEFAAWLEQAAETHHERVLGRLILRDVDGRRLPVDRARSSHSITSRTSLPKASWTDVRLVERLVFPISAPPLLLTFQMSPDGELSGLRSQWVLAVHGPQEERERLVRLTSGGNAETIELSAPDTTGTCLTAQQALPADVNASAEFESFVFSMLQQRKYTGITAVLRETTSGLTLDVYAPLPLVETFITTSRSNADFVEVDEQRVILSRWNELVASRVQFKIDDRLPLASLQHQAFLAPDAADASAAAAPRRLGAFTARTMLRYSLPVADPSASCELTWNLFNSSVLNADVIYASSFHSIVRELSTYSPILRIR